MEPKIGDIYKISGSWIYKVVDLLPDNQMEICDFSRKLKRIWNRNYCFNDIYLGNNLKIINILYGG